jgi:hypothetical protein
MRATGALFAGLLLSCVGPQPEPASTDLYSASARDYGFDFDAHVWEVERRPQLSVVRDCNHHDAVISAESFFTIGCWGELALSRRYEHHWKLSSRLVECRVDPGQQDRESVMAFSHTSSTSELPPDVMLELGPGSFQWSGEAKTDIELARQHLGHWPTTTP